MSRDISILPIGSTGISRTDSFLGAFADHLILSGLWHEPRFRQESKPEPKAHQIEARPQRGEECWEHNVPVEQLHVGDRIRHPDITYGRVIVSIKPHPKGGVQVKTRPAYIFLKKDAPGKILKAHLKGVASRWDGKTYIVIDR